MENTNVRHPVTVDYVVFNDMQAHNRWLVKKLITALIVVIIFLFASNMAWLYFWNQYDYSSETVTTTADSEGNGMAVNITGENGGDINYGESISDQTDNNTD